MHDLVTEYRYCRNFIPLAFENRGTVLSVSEDFAFTTTPFFLSLRGTMEGRCRICRYGGGTCTIGFRKTP